MTISEHDKAWYKAKIVGRFMHTGQRAKFENIAERDAQMLFKIFQDLDKPVYGKFVHKPDTLKRGPLKTLYFRCIALFACYNADVYSRKPKNYK